MSGIGNMRLEKQKNVAGMVAPGFVVRKLSEQYLPFEGAMLVSLGLQNMSK